MFDQSLCWKDVLVSIEHFGNNVESRLVARSTFYSYCICFVQQIIIKMSERLAGNIILPEVRQAHPDRKSVV